MNNGCSNMLFHLMAFSESPCLKGYSEGHFEDRKLVLGVQYLLTEFYWSSKNQLCHKCYIQDMIMQTQKKKTKIHQLRHPFAEV
jgi:hypothetical protein